MTEHHNASFTGLEMVNLPPNSNGEFNDPEPKIREVHISLAGPCHLECAWCWGVDHSIKEQYPPEAWESLLDALKTRGVEEIVFTGGEPLMAPSFMRLLRYAKDLGFRVTLSTNAIAKQRLAAALELLDENDEVAIPLDGSTPEMNEVMRRDSQRFHGYEAALEGMQMTQAKGCKLKVRSVVSQKNIHDIVNLPDVLIASGIDCNNIVHKVYQIEPIGPRVEESWKDEWLVDEADTIATWVRLKRRYDAVLLKQPLQNENKDTDQVTSKNRVRLQLYKDTTDRYVHTEPDGAAYTIVIDKEGMPQILLFGDIINDYDKTMSMYNVYSSEKYILQRVFEDFIDRYPALAADEEIQYSILSLLLSNAYDSAYFSKNEGTSFEMPPVEETTVPYARTPRTIELDLSFDDAGQLLTPDKYKQIIDDCISNNAYNFTILWNDLHQATTLGIIQYIQAFARTEIVLQTTSINPHILSSLIQTGAIREFVVPLQVHTQTSPLSLLRSSTKNIFDESQNPSLQLLTQLQKYPGLRATAKVPVRADMIDLIERLPTVLEHKGIQPSSPYFSIQLDEQEMTKDNKTDSEGSVGFENQLLTRAAAALTVKNRAAVSINHWAKKPADRFCIGPAGVVFSDEILATDGSLIRYVYGNVQNEDIALHLRQYTQHYLRALDRKARIERPAMPHGERSSIAAAAVASTILLKPTDSLGVYYYRGKVKTKDRA